MTSPQRDELRQLIASKILPDMTVDQVAEAIAGMFYTVTDRWDRIDTTMLNHPGEQWIEQRSLVCEVMRDATSHERVVDRSIR